MAGPLGLYPLQLQHAKNAHPLARFTTIGDQYDAEIARLFERHRRGLSVDAFLADSQRSRRFTQLAQDAGIDATEYQINMRLLAMRKRSGGGAFRETTRETRTTHLVALYGTGVEAAMLQVLTRFGASIDDMIAHPVVGREFVRFAREVSRGGKPEEYRLCALQIRKSRHYSGAIAETAARLHARALDRRWHPLGSPAEAQGADLPRGAGIAELTSNGQALFVLRHQRIREAVEHSFAPTVVHRLLASDWFTGIQVEHPRVRFVSAKDLPSATPKTWELVLIRDHEPVFNWPLKYAA